MGVVPKDTPFVCNQSCKSVCPLDIANCKEDRYGKPKKVDCYNVNKQKDALKKNGITVDGVHYAVRFKVILDLKTLYFLLEQIGKANFQLGKQGTEVECCFICKALRVFCLKHFSMSKANIGGFKGIRDDLEFLLEEDLSSINLCALHCKLRNTEQLLSLLGLFPYKVGSLDECNAKLANYGPENFGSKITVKMKEGQETAVEKHNIQVSSFSGTFYLVSFLNSLPHDKFKSYFADPESVKEVLRNKVTFCNDRIKVWLRISHDLNTFTRDFGSKQETITLTGSGTSKNSSQDQYVSQAYQTPQALGKVLGKVSSRVLPQSPRKRKAVVFKLAHASGFLRKKKCTRGNRGLPKETVKFVKVFFQLDSFSRQAPGRKDFVTVRENNTKHHIQKSHLLRSLRECYSIFMKENPTTEIGFNNMKRVKKIQKVLKEGTVDDLLEDLEVQLPSFVEHVFVKRQQARIFKEKIEHLTEEEAVVQVDFAENFSCKYQGEVQSAYWSQDQSTWIEMGVQFSGSENEDLHQNDSDDQDSSSLSKGSNSTSSVDEDETSEEKGDFFGNASRNSHHTYKEVSSESSKEDSKSHDEEGDSREEEVVTGNKGSGGPDAKEIASNANKSSSDKEEMSEKKDNQVQQGLSDKLLSLFKGCALFSLPHHLDCQVNAVSDG
ncbi:unnamed protein product [Porites lobata]|uniref:Uncharacterized protein n=1 Tax=Porites lobata TaxID=104759 RepID=A0ABN8S474_9CNID|nr:unnamed protein product [Porites lobata]